MRLVTALTLVVLSSVAAHSETLTGRASVIDADTIDIHGERIRINGVDAPEARQICNDRTGEEYRCGKVAAEALDVFLSQSRPTRCETVGRDRYKRFVANCFRADGASVATWLVRNGHALDWPRYSKGRYAADQGEAKARKVGMWQGQFIPPWDWRKR